METIDSAYFLAIPAKYVFMRFYRLDVLRFKLIVALKICKRQIQTGKVKVRKQFAPTDHHWKQR